MEYLTLENQKKKKSHLVNFPKFAATMKRIRQDLIFRFIN